MRVPFSWLCEYVAWDRSVEELAELLTAMSLEDQVVVFRVLPRRDAAAVFEYLSRDDQNALLKAMGQEAVAMTDHGAMYGAIEFYKAAKAQSVKPIIGVDSIGYQKATGVNQNREHLGKVVVLDPQQ